MLYKRGLAGEIKGFTGVSDPYEEPLSLDVLIESDRESVELSRAKIIRELERRWLVPTVAAVSDPSVEEQTHDGNVLELFSGIPALV